MVVDKLRALLNLKGLKQVEICSVFGMEKNGFNNKLRMSATRFNTTDLIKLAELTNTTLCFVDKKNGKVLIEFDTDDIQQETE